MWMCFTLFSGDWLLFYFILCDARSSSPLFPALLSSTREVITRWRAVEEFGRSPLKLFAPLLFCDWARKLCLFLIPPFSLSWVWNKNCSMIRTLNPPYSTHYLINTDPCTNLCGLDKGDIPKVYCCPGAGIEQETYTPHSYTKVKIKVSIWPLQKF